MYFIVGVECPRVAQAPKDQCTNSGLRCLRQVARSVMLLFSRFLRSRSSICSQHTPLAAHSGNALPGVKRPANERTETEQHFEK
jgi:hypothetical protein